ncbi:hypothetical protein OSB04_011966 [Centaurea solstitialis]|uniref:Uncharacterized protein n=1 Tax=Centaurea solstitialis TaxID=347529 RepID=A0AA38TTK5_9ASTR|nr:hypothetical protein OSB04_011966 [Centaurea solstitialis]
MVVVQWGGDDGKNGEGSPEGLVAVRFTGTGGRRRVHRKEVYRSGQKNVAADALSRKGLTKVVRVVRQFVKEYQMCQALQDDTTTSPGLLQQLPIPKEAWMDISIDFVTSLPKIFGKKVFVGLLFEFSSHFIVISSHISQISSHNSRNQLESEVNARVRTRVSSQRGLKARSELESVIKSRSEASVSKQSSVR